MRIEDCAGARLGRSRRGRAGVSLRRWMRVRPGFRDDILHLLAGLGGHVPNGYARRVAALTCSLGKRPLGCDGESKANYSEG